MKKAQIKMMESVMVLVIFFVLLSFGFIFFAFYKQSKDASELSIAQNLIAIQARNRVKSLPELQCTREGTVEFDCYSKLKLMAFNQTVYPEASNKELYDDIFPFVEISIVELYNQDLLPTPNEYLIVNNSLERFKYKRVFYSPATIYDAFTDVNGFGYLKIEVYQE